MSEGIVIALITAIGSLLGGVIGQKIVASATVRAAEIKTNPNRISDSKSKKPLSLSGILGGALIGAVLTLVVLAAFGMLNFGKNNLPTSPPIPTDVLNQLPNDPSVTPIATTDLGISITNIPTNECNPASSLNLKYLSNFTNPMWSAGVWVSENMLNFIPPDKQAGIIDTNDPDFGDFQIWISQCYVQLHGYSDGIRFWPLQKGVQSTGTPITLGQLTTISLPQKTGFWGLGDQFKP
jgi:hypothetical protein